MAIIDKSGKVYKFSPKANVLADEYYTRALHVIVEKDCARTGLLQRELQIGFMIALRIMEKLRDDGFIKWPSDDGRVPGEVFVDKIKASGLLNYN